MSRAPDSVNRNVLAARALTDAWARHGVTEACIGSGSRSAPLVEALAADGRIRIHPHVDERSAAFFALGIGSATGRPALVVTTSGTATANLFPAVIEASQSEIPVLIVTADRPAALRGTDANQTIDQHGLYGRYPRWTVDLPPPDPSPQGLERLRAAAATAWSAALGPAPGPAHVNVQFEKPLEPTVVAGDVPDGLSAKADDSGGETQMSGAADTSVAAPEAGGRLADLLNGAERPVVVCGPNHDPTVGQAAVALASARGCPILADPLSGARFGQGLDNVIGVADVALGADAVASGLDPDLIVRVGRAPTSATIGRFLDRHGDRHQVILDAGGLWRDHLDTADEVVRGAPAAVLQEASGQAVPGDAGWLDRWRSVEAACRPVLSEACAEAWFEGAIAATVASELPSGGTWFIGNSMPIRDVDAFAAAREAPIRTIGFRGASGIDGNVSGALGAATVRAAPAAALIGDLTLLHDVGALLAAAEVAVPMVIVVIQNRGGGIFHMLPIRGFDPPFTPYVVMPQSVEFDTVAAAARIPHRLVSSRPELVEALADGWQDPGLTLVEARVDREQNWALRNDVRSRAEDAATAALR